MVNFGEFLKTWSLRSNSVTRQVSFNRSKIGGKYQNWKIPMRHFGWFSNTVRLLSYLWFVLERATHSISSKRKCNWQQWFIFRKYSKSRFWSISYHEIGQCSKKVSFHYYVKFLFKTFLGLKNQLLKNWEFSKKMEFSKKFGNKKKKSGNLKKMGLKNNG